MLRHVTFGMPKRFRQNKQAPSLNVKKGLSLQRSATPRVLELMAEIGAQKDQPLCIEFFFYAKEPQDAQQLAAALSTLGYKVEEPRPSWKDQICVSGWTPPLPSDERSMVSWSEAMVRSGGRFHAIFDGWGTFPKQEENFFDQLDKS
jgi:hypothetical protein